MSTSECTASLSMAAEPVIAAAANFAAATSILPASAAHTALRLPLLAMRDYASCRANAATRNAQTGSQLEESVGGPNLRRTNPKHSRP